MVTTRKRAREVAAQQADLTPTPSLVAPPATNTDDSDDVDDDDDAEERILSETYDGAKDAAGRPHGAGRLTVAFLRGRHRGRNTFQGHFKHGDKSPQHSSPLPCPASPPAVPHSHLSPPCRHGPGEWRFDAGTDEESTLSGPFLADALEGDGRYTSSDGSYTLGPYRGGILHGRVEEFSPTGTLVFTGQYRDNARNGEGTLYHTHGGVYSGQWRDGLFHGASNIYTYPPATPLPFSFRGQWEDGHMTACRLFLGDQPADDIVYSQDESELGGPIAEQPMLMDAYEQQCCFVKQSSLGPQAGEGLFARIDLPPGVVVSFYNGIKQEEHIVSTRPHTHLPTLGSLLIAATYQCGVCVLLCAE